MAGRGGVGRHVDARVRAGVEVRTLRLGGLFSGIGGFELAWQQRGGEVAWMCEVDQKARKVLEARFPGVRIYEDVRELDPAEVEPVDVLTGGSPCQGFSVAGARTGMLHGESRLFADYVRILDGLAERGLRWAVWENVPGVLSIKNPDGERTFPHVIGALAGAADPVRLDPRRRWNAGVVGGGGRAVAWRVVDSRHFGVPQRRRRVYATVAFGDSAADRAGRAVLAVPEGVRGNPPACVTKGQGVAGGVAAGVAGPSSVAHTLTKASSKGATEDGTGRGIPIVPQSFNLMPDIAGTLGAKASGGIDDLDRMTFIPDQPQAFNWQQGEAELALADTAQTIGSTSRPGVLEADPDTKAYGVRRLTPVECERLQAFPDGWTEPAGSDSARYKALGNAVTVTVPHWLFGRIMEVGE